MSAARTGPVLCAKDKTARTAMARLLMWCLRLCVLVASIIVTVSPDLVS
jgi:hypothetical protein